MMMKRAHEAEEVGNRCNRSFQRWVLPCSWQCL